MTSPGVSQRHTSKMCDIGNHLLCHQSHQCH
jgi:hypothetical protein